MADPKGCNIHANIFLKEAYIEDQRLGHCIHFSKVQTYTVYAQWPTRYAPGPLHY